MLNERLKWEITRKLRRELGEIGRWYIALRRYASLRYCDRIHHRSCFFWRPQGQSRLMPPNERAYQHESQFAASRRERVHRL